MKVMRFAMSRGKSIKNTKYQKQLDLNTMIPWCKITNHGNSGDNKFSNNSVAVNLCVLERGEEGREDLHLWKHWEIVSFLLKIQDK